MTCFGLYHLSQAIWDIKLNKNAYSTIDLSARSNARMGIYMRIEDIVLVMENDKGTETGFLTDFAAHFKAMGRMCGGDMQALEKSVRELYGTKENAAWTDLYAAANKSCHARFCSGEEELRAFLSGGKSCGEGEPPYRIDAGKCAGACLDAIDANGITLQGEYRYWDMNYTEMPHVFRQGEILHDFAGREYQVLDLLAENDPLLMAGDGYFLVALDARLYRREPQKGGFPPETMRQGFLWEKEVELGTDLTAIHPREAMEQYKRDTRPVPVLDDEYGEER